jgi:pimeloyl-ACP methyl ester carboxylesterase
MRETRGLNRLDCGIFAWTPDTEVSYAGMTEDTFAFLVQQGIQKADLVGISDGGQIALRLAFKHPEMVRRVVVFHFHQLVIESVAAPPASAGSLVLGLDPINGRDNGVTSQPRIQVFVHQFLNSLHLAAVVNVKGPQEVTLHLLLPLVLKGRRHNDQDPSAALPCGQLLHDETGLNGLSKTHVVSD